MTENPYLIRQGQAPVDSNDPCAAAWQEGFEAGRASRDAEVEALKSERATERTFSKECLEEKDRECHYRLKFSAQLAENEAYIKDLDALLQETHTKAEAAYARGLQASAEDFAEKEAECERLRERLSAVIASADHALGIAPASKGEGDG